MSTTKQTSPPPSHPVLIGRDVGPFGRVFRLVTGGLLVAGGIASQLADPDLGAPAAATTAGYLVALAAFYLVLHQVLGERVLARVDPFVSTVLVLAPLGVLALSVFPESLHVAITLYIGASLVLNAVIRYGGCEVIALPTVLSGRRYVVYCPVNIVDAAERPLHGSRDLPGRAAAVLALVVAGYFLLGSPLLGWFGLADPVSPWWGLLLLAPAGLLAVRGWQARHGGAFGLALGAAAAAAGALVLAGLVEADVLFALAVLVGLLLAAYRTLVTARARRREDH